MFFKKEDKRLVSIYLIISFVSVTLDFSILFVLTSLANIHYFISALVGYSVGSIVNYSLNKKYNFRDKQKVRMQFPVYISIALIGLVFTQILLVFFVEVFNLFYIYARLISSLIVLVWNFWGHKNVTFKKIRAKREFKKYSKQIKKEKKKARKKKEQ